MEPGKWQKVTLNLEDDFKIQQKGIRPDQFRGELFVYNKSRASVKIILDACRNGSVRGWASESEV